MHEQAGGVDLGGHVGEHERDRLVHDDRLAERLALLGVVERVLVGGPGDADGLGADRRAGGLEGRHGRLLAARLVLRLVQRLAGLGQLCVELVLAAEQAGAGDAHVVEHDLGGVRGPDAVLLVLLALRQARACSGGTMKLAWPRPLSSGSTAATTTWMSAMPPLVIHALVPLSTHSSLASS